MEAVVPVYKLNNGSFFPPQEMAGWNIKFLNQERIYLDVHGS